MLEDGICEGCEVSERSEERGRRIIRIDRYFRSTPRSMRCLVL